MRTCPALLAAWARRWRAGVGTPGARSGQPARSQHGQPAARHSNAPPPRPPSGQRARPSLLTTPRGPARGQRPAGAPAAARRSPRAAAASSCRPVARSAPFAHLRIPLPAESSAVSPGAPGL
jgi:hypothetical protein